MYFLCAALTGLLCALDGRSLVPAESASFRIINSACYPYLMQRWIKNNNYYNNADKNDYNGRGPSIIMRAISSGDSKVSIHSNNNNNFDNKWSVICKKCPLRCQLASKLTTTTMKTTTTTTVIPTTEAPAVVTDANSNVQNNTDGSINEIDDSVNNGVTTTSTTTTTTTTEQPKTVTITLYGNNNQVGELETHTLKIGQCETLSSFSSKRVTSVNTYGSCFKLCERRNCQGFCIEVKKGSSSHNRLRDLHFERRTSSIIPCESQT